MAENKNRTILVYGIKGLPMLNLAKSAAKLGIRCKAVPDTKTKFRVSELLSEKELPEAEPTPLSGKYAVFDGFDGKLDEGFGLVNQAASGVVKAVHTRHNDSWRFADLCFNIQQEQNTLRKFAKKK